MIPTKIAEWKVPSYLIFSIASDLMKSDSVLGGACDDMDSAVSSEASSAVTGVLTIVRAAQ